MTNYYKDPCIALTGGGDGSLDAIDGSLVTDGCAAYTDYAGKHYVHILDEDSGLDEDSPHVIKPDSNAGAKRWILSTDIEDSNVFIQSGTGAVSRTAQDKTREIVSVKDFGAVGNGVADDTDAFDKAAATGLAYYVPATADFYSITTAPTGKCYGSGAVKLLGAQIYIPLSIKASTAVRIIPFPDTSNFTVIDVDGSILEVSVVVQANVADGTVAAAETAFVVTNTPTNVAAGMAVYNQNAPVSIAPGCLVSTVISKTITLDAALVAPGITNLDAIWFISNPTWFTDTVTYAVQHGYPLICEGQGGKNNDTVGPVQLIVTNGPVNVPASIFQYIDLTGVELEIIGTHGVVFDSAEYMEYRGPIITNYHGDGSMYKWYPQNQTPVDHLVGFSGNKFEFGALAFQGGAVSTGRVFEFMPAAGTISENRFVWKEVFGGLRTLEGGGYLQTPILVNNCGASTYFRNNIFDGQHLHGFTAFGFTEGTSATNQANINNNQWRIGKIAPAPDATSAVGFRSYGSYNTYIGAVTNNEMTADNYANPFNFTSGANYNRAFVNHEGATAGYIDSGTRNTCHANGLFGVIGVGSNPGTVGIGVDNNVYISARTAAGNANVGIIKIDASDLPAFGQARTGASVAGNFVADFWIQFHDANGANFYIPGKNAAW